MSEAILWSPGVTLEQVEQQVIQRCFAHFKGNKTHTASALDIAIRTLDSKLEKYSSQKTAVAMREQYLRDQEQDYLRRARGLGTDHAHAVIVVQEPVATAAEPDQVTILRKAKK